MHTYIYGLGSRQDLQGHTRAPSHTSTPHTNTHTHTKRIHTQVIMRADAQGLAAQRQVEAARKAAGRMGMAQIEEQMKVRVHECMCVWLLCPAAAVHMKRGRTHRPFTFGSAWATTQKPNPV